MKRTLYFTSLGFLLFSSLVAQETTNQSFVDEQWDTKTNTWVPYARNQAAYDEAGRYLGAYLEEVQEEQWLLTYRSEYVYHGTSDQIDTRKTYSFQSQTENATSYWRNFQYTEDGLLLLSDTKSVVEDMEGMPFDSSYTRRTWTYDANGEVLTEDIYRESLNFSEPAYAINRVEYSYEAGGCESRRVFSEGIPDFLSPTLQVRTINNSNCQVQEEIEEAWNNPGSFWEFRRRSVYSYEGDQLSEVIHYERDPILNVWKEQEREVYEVSGDTLRTATYVWDEMTNTWSTEPNASSLKVERGNTIFRLENQSSFFWTIRVYDDEGRELLNEQKSKDLDGDWVNFYVETKEYDASGRVIQETRSWDYDKELGLYQGILIVENAYVESQVLLQVNTAVSQRNWISSEGRYDFASSTSSVTYDYLCNDQESGWIRTSNGQNQRRRTIQVDQSLLAACGQGPANALTVYPNPAQDRVTLKVDGVSRQALEIEIMDLQGRLIKVENFEKGLFLTEIDITDLVPGTYIARVQKEGVYNHFKFIKTAE
ncbi:MAG: T9SS type A sorting domain-containing protein [Bacteroidota bacterium]